MIVEGVSFNAALKDYEAELVEVEDIMKQYINQSDNAEIFEN